MRLDELVAELGHRTIGSLGDLSVEVGSVSCDSRRVETGSLFCCVRGEHADGHDFAASAVESGAAALLVERPLGLAVPQIVVHEARESMGHAAAAVYGWPSRSLQVVGVTGTNGKTTVTQLLGSILDAAGRANDVLGTLSGVRTTPEAPDLQRWLADRVAQGVSAVAIEVSSHALQLHRVSGTRFAVVVFTNLSRDHLDFHHTMEEYFRAKASLFDPTYADRGVVNLDSPYGRILRDASSLPVVGYSIDDASDLSVGPSSSQFTWRDQRVHMRLGGRFNVYNALAAAEAGIMLGLSPATIAEGLGRAAPVSGRFEVIDAGQAFTVIVDYAHTPDGLEQLLRSVDEVVPAGGRVHVMFGCGGNRDRTKRAPMGEVAARLADRVVLTADNSRGESTGAIIAEVKRGFDSVAGRRATELLVDPDRRSAIARTMAGAAAGDIVLLAGKGHETTQTIGASVIPFDDRVVAREVLGETHTRESGS